jgi:polyhydroxybutyrate depolymerase
MKPTTLSTPAGRRTAAPALRAGGLLLAALSAFTLVGCGFFRRDRSGPAKQYQPGKGDSSRSMQAGGRERTYIVHLPPSYDGTRATPLVLVLHGGTGNAQGTVVMTGMNETADKDGFIAVYPNGTGLLGDRILTWNVLFGFGYALRNNVDDTGFIRDLLGVLERDYKIDSRRIFATGISNGGMMAYLLGSELSGQIAAIAPVAGSIGGRKGAASEMITFPQPAEPVSVIAFHGRQDNNVPYDGGQGRGLVQVDYPPVSYSIDTWVRWDGCSSPPTVTTSPNGNVVTRVYPGGRQGTAVELVTINDGGHSWPGGKSYPGGTVPTQDISANDMMWQFFSEHPKQ